MNEFEFLITLREKIFVCQNLMDRISRFILRVLPFSHGLTFYQNTHKIIS